MERELKLIHSTKGDEYARRRAELQAALLTLEAA